MKLNSINCEIIDLDVIEGTIVNKLIRKVMLTINTSYFDSQIRERKIIGAAKVVNHSGLGSPS